MSKVGKGYLNVGWYYRKNNDMDREKRSIVNKKKQNSWEYQMYVEMVSDKSNKLIQSTSFILLIVRFFSLLDKNHSKRESTQNNEDYKVPLWISWPVEEKAKKLMRKLRTAKWVENGWCEGIQRSITSMTASRKVTDLTLESGLTLLMKWMLRRSKWEDLTLFSVLFTSPWIIIISDFD